MNAMSYLILGTNFQGRAYAYDILRRQDDQANRS